MHIFSRVVNAIRSSAAYAVVTIWVILFGPLGLILTRFTRQTRTLYALGRAGARLGLAIAGIRFHVTGLEHVQHDRPTVYYANHTSNIEPPIIFLSLISTHPQLKAVYKAELRTVFPILRTAFDVAGFVPIDRSNRDQSISALQGASDSIRSGNSFLIFPEGTRNRGDGLLPFKKGGIVMAIMADAPLVPVAVRGARTAMQKGSLFIRPVTVHVTIGEPIVTATRTLVDRDTVIQDARNALFDLLLKS